MDVDESSFWSTLENTHPHWASNGSYDSDLLKGWDCEPSSNPSEDSCSSPVHTFQSLDILNCNTIQSERRYSQEISDDCCRKEAIREADFREPTAFDNGLQSSIQTITQIQPNDNKPHFLTAAHKQWGVSRQAGRNFCFENHNVRSDCVHANVLTPNHQRQTSAHQATYPFQVHPQVPVLEALCHSQHTKKQIISNTQGQNGYHFHQHDHHSSTIDRLTTFLWQWQLNQMLQQLIHGQQQQQHQYDQHTQFLLYQTLYNTLQNLSHLQASTWHEHKPKLSFPSSATQPFPTNTYQIELSGQHPIHFVDTNFMESIHENRNSGAISPLLSKSTIQLQPLLQETPGKGNKFQVSERYKQFESDVVPSSTYLQPVGSVQRSLMLRQARSRRYRARRKGAFLKREEMAIQLHNECYGIVKKLESINFPSETIQEKLKVPYFQNYTKDK